VISYGLWQRMFGGDSSIVGRAIRLNGNPSTVVGVMPPEFAMPDHAEIWVPLRLDPTAFNCWCLDMVGRMKPGITDDGAKRDLIATIDAFALSRRDVFPDAKPTITRRSSSCRSCKESLVTLVRRCSCSSRPLACCCLLRARTLRTCCCRARRAQS
jgi:hypothetical protein